MPRWAQTIEKNPVPGGTQTHDLKILWQMLYQRNHSCYWYYVHNVVRNPAMRFTANENDALSAIAATAQP